MPVLRVRGEIDTVSALASALRDINTIYNRSYRIIAYSQTTIVPSLRLPWFGALSPIHIRPPDEARLRIESARYGTSGEINLRGSGQPLEVLLKVINQFDPRGRGRRELGNRILQIEALQRTVEFWRSLGIDQETIQEMVVRQLGRPIARLLSPSSKPVAQLAEMLPSTEP